VETHHNCALRYLFGLLILTSLGSLTSCKTTVNIYESDSNRSVSEQRQEIVEDAKSLIGSPYKYAAKGPKRFDCSGLVGYVYDQSNIDAAGSASSLASQGKSISMDKVQPGDLIFYKRKKGSVFHVSIISRVRRGQLWVIHSTTSRGVIEEDVLSSSYWKPLIFKTVSLSSYK